MVSPILVFLAVPCAVISAVTLRPCDVDIGHVVDTAAAVSHSRTLRKLVGEEGENVVYQPNVNDSELQLIVEFINTVPAHEISQSTPDCSEVQCKFMAMDVHQQCRLVASAHNLDMETLMVAIASTKRKWNDIVAMRDRVPMEALQAIVHNTPGIVRLRQVADSGDHHEVTNQTINQIRDLLVTGDVATVASGAHGVENVLLWAARNGEISVVELLVDAPGIDVNARNEKGQTPLHLAAYYAHVDIVQLLLSSSQIIVSAYDSNQNTPLHAAIQGGHSKFMLYLHQHNDIVESLDPHYREVGDVLERGVRAELFSNATGGRHSQVVRMLTKAPGIDVNACNTERSTPLHWAATVGYAEAVKALLDVTGIDLGMQDILGTNALDQALTRKFADIVEMLTRHANESARP